MTRAMAYLNYGRWVVDCPAASCTDARAVHSPAGTRRTNDVCARGHDIEIVMPDPQLEAQINATLATRAEDADKAWYPKGHPRALLTGQPSGQTIAELAAENAKVAQFRAGERRRRDTKLRELLGELGIAVRSDGSFEGNI